MHKISISLLKHLVTALALVASFGAMALMPPPSSSSSSSSSTSSAPRPATMPPLRSGFIECASQGQTCSFTGTRTVLVDSYFEYTNWSSTVVATESMVCRGYLGNAFARCAYSVEQIAALNGLVATASSQSGIGRAPAKAIDGQADTRWEASNSSPGAWLQVKRAQPFKLLKIEVSEYGNRIRGYRLEYLNGSVWTPLREGATVGAKVEMNINSNIAVITTAVRIVTTATSAGQPSISEFRVTGAPQ